MRVLTVEIGGAKVPVTDERIAWRLLWTLVDAGLIRISYHGTGAPPTATVVVSHETGGTVRPGRRALLNALRVLEGGPMKGSILAGRLGYSSGKALGNLVSSLKTERVGLERDEVFTIVGTNGDKEWGRGPRAADAIKILEGTA